jgi:uncharacterized protein (TIGR03083 family)
MDARREAEQERGELADLLEGLSEEQWEAPSLCEGWTVRQVVAHVISYDELPWKQLVARAVRARFSPDRMNALGVEEYGARSPAALVALLRGHLRPSGLAGGMGGAIGLVDAVIHQQDIRRPLGMPREIPNERVRLALGLALRAPVIRGFWNARGVRLVAEDVSWARGKGPEARGPGEAVLMTLAGRRGVASELSGPGAEVLSSRLG